MRAGDIRPILSPTGATLNLPPNISQWTCSQISGLQTNCKRKKDPKLTYLWSVLPNSKLGMMNQFCFSTLQNNCPAVEGLTPQLWRKCKASHSHRTKTCSWLTVQHALPRSAIFTSMLIKSESSSWLPGSPPRWKGGREIRSFSKPTGMHHLPQKVLVDLPAFEVFQPSNPKML